MTLRVVFWVVKLIFPTCLLIAGTAYYALLATTWVQEDLSTKTCYIIKGRYILHHFGSDFYRKTVLTDSRNIGHNHANVSTTFFRNNLHIGGVQIKICEGMEQTRTFKPEMCPITYATQSILKSSEHRE
ncbi:hypothetical protein ACJX0J_032736, partial [Zea mays]